MYAHTKGQGWETVYVCPDGLGWGVYACFKPCVVTMPPKCTTFPVPTMLPHVPLCLCLPPTPRDHLQELAVVGTLWSGWDSKAPFPLLLKCIPERSKRL
jgi:hypothetical protein